MKIAKKGHYFYTSKGNLALSLYTNMIILRKRKEMKLNIMLMAALKFCLMKNNFAKK